MGSATLSAAIRTVAEHLAAVVPDPVARDHYRSDVENDERAHRGSPLEQSRREVDPGRAAVAPVPSDAVPPRPNQEAAALAVCLIAVAPLKDRDGRKRFVLVCAGHRCLRDARVWTLCHG